MCVVEPFVQSSEAQHYMYVGDTHYAAFNYPGQYTYTCVPVENMTCCRFAKRARLMCKKEADEKRERKEDAAARILQKVWRRHAEWEKMRIRFCLRRKVCERLQYMVRRICMLCMVWCISCLVSTLVGRGRAHALLPALQRHMTSAFKVL